MKSSAPWSVKGVERDARETAKEAARREGMTVGEWLNQVINAASDPASSNGQIEGLKISDLVSAIEHVSRRVIGTETQSAEALEEIGKNLGGVVDRLQRLERVHPVDAQTQSWPAQFEERLTRVEGRDTGRERIEALRALEKAVGQIALQFDAAQKSSNERLAAIEQQTQQIAGGGPAAAAAIDHLKNTIDGVSGRIARLERAAQDANKTKPEPQVDPEFAERTGARLRVLGDEIKRGGDQIRGLEGMIKKLSDQIDAAERRSSEGVHKVAETIAALRSQIEDSEAQKVPDPRAEIEAAIADAERRNEERISEVQRSFEAILDQLEQSTQTHPEPVATSAFIEPAAVAETFKPAGAAPPSTEVEAEPEGTALDEALLAFEMDLPEEPVADGDVDDFDLEDEPASAIAPPANGSDVLREVEAALSGAAPGQGTEAAPATSEAEEIDSILAELEGLGGEASVDLPPTEPTTTSVAAQKPANYLAEARRAAKEAAEKAAAETTGPKRKLTAKQRAILAAKVRKKRLAAEQAAQQQTPAKADAPAALVATSSTAPSAERPGETAPKGFIAKAAAAIGGVLPRAGSRTPVEATETVVADPAAAPTLREKYAGGYKSGIKPLTIALGAAIVLALGSLIFMVKDMILGGKPKTVRTEAPAAASAPAPTVAIKDAASLEVPAAPVVKPRTLYLDSVAKLKAATTEADTAAAMKGLEEAAALGHPPAQLQLGELYKLGQGVPQDAAQARAWYERAANGGNVLAMHRVGVMAARGQGGAADQAAAVAWFEKAANLGLVDSQYNLGAIFHPGGEGAASGAQDAAKAYFWYTLAAKNGDTQAGALAAGLAKDLSPDKRKGADEKVATWTAGTPDPDANEVAPAS